VADLAVIENGGPDVLHVVPKSPRQVRGAERYAQLSWLWTGSYPMVADVQKLDLAMGALNATRPGNSAITSRDWLLKPRQNFIRADPIWPAHSHQRRDFTVIGVCGPSCRKARDNIHRVIIPSATMSA